MLDEIAQTVIHVRDALDSLAVRGLRSASRDDLALLRAAGEEFERIGAAHLAERIADVVRASEAGEAEAATAWLRAQNSLRLFDRVLTLQMAGELLSQLSEEEESEMVCDAGELAENDEEESP